MNPTKSLAAAALCLLGSTTGSVSASSMRLAQNVEYMICVTTIGNVSRCEVREPVAPCPGPVAYPRPRYASPQSACAEAKKRPECSGGVTGC
jgi:hypothetical protein